MYQNVIRHHESARSPTCRHSDTRVADRDVESTALHFLVLTVAGRIKRRQADALEYLLEENRVLREHLEIDRMQVDEQEPAILRRSGLHGRTMSSRATEEVERPEPGGKADAIACQLA